MNINEVSNDVLQRIGEAQKNPLVDADLVRAFTQSGTATTGITFYDLEAPSKKLYPVLTPLRNRIARRTGGRGIQSNWKAITAIGFTNTMGFGVSEGNRGGVITQTSADYLAKFVGLGLENYTTFEADYAAEGFEDVKALAVQQLLQQTMIQEELCDLGGNGTVALGTTPTPTTSTATTGGTLAAATYNVYCVALTLQGYMQVAAINNGSTGQTLSLANGLTASVTRTNIDGTTDTFGGGVAQKSAAASQATTGSTSTISASVAPVRGAVAYAWYWGTSGNELLGAVSTINSVLITATATGTQNISALPSSDKSTNALIYDGIMTQIMKSGSGAIFVDQATGTPGTGTKLTSDGAGGISEINTDLASFWDQYRLSPDCIYVGSQVLLDMNAIIIKNGGAPLIRYSLDGGGTTIDAGTVVGSILNKITNKKVQIVCHPNMPPGMLLYWSDSVPYPLADVGSVVLKHLRRDYYQIEWPRIKRRYEYGVYFDGVLKCYFPPAYGIRRNIAPGN